MQSQQHPEPHKPKPPVELRMVGGGDGLRMQVKAGEEWVDVPAVTAAEVQQEEEEKAKKAGEQSHQPANLPAGAGGQAPAGGQR